jgi:hypothetical protein
LVFKKSILVVSKGFFSANFHHFATEKRGIANSTKGGVFFFFYACKLPYFEAKKAEFAIFKP